MLLPLGALGVSAALAAAPASVAGAAGDTKPPVGERLAAIRQAVSQVTAEEGRVTPENPSILKAWWGNWHPGFWGNGGWRNWWHPGWHNWHNGWRNGWGNGGWHNWPNFWHNW